MDLKQEQSVNGTTSTDALSLDFFSLPSEVRNTIYGLVLLRDRPINPFHKYCRPQSFTLGLLRVNKAVHREATSFLYAQNRFELIASRGDILIFFDDIGQTNTRYIRHVQIEFPLLTKPDEELTSHLRIFAAIKRHCTNLETARLGTRSLASLRRRLAHRGTPSIDQELKSVDDCFRASLSFREFVVLIDRGWAAGGALESLFEKYGWRLSREGLPPEWEVIDRGVRDGMRWVKKRLKVVID